MLSIKKIVVKFIEDVKKPLLEKHNITLNLSEPAVEYLADKGYDSQFGARPLHRAIQKYLEDPLAEEILNMTIKAGDTMIAELDKDAGKIIFKLKEEPKKKEKKSQS